MVKGEGAKTKKQKVTTTTVKDNNRSTVEEQPKANEVSTLKRPESKSSKIKKTTQQQQPQQQQSHNIVNQSTPNTRSNTRKNNITRQNTFGRLDLLPDQSPAKNSPLSFSRGCSEASISCHDNEEISFTPFFGA